MPLFLEKTEVKEQSYKLFRSDSMITPKGESLRRFLMTESV